jgi:hypothetical protein
MTNREVRRVIGQQIFLHRVIGPQIFARRRVES